MVLAPFFLPLITNNYTQYIVNLTLVYVIVGLGLNLLLGYAGQFAFAHPAFFGIGAYCTGLLIVKVHVPFWIALPAAGVLVSVIGLVVGFPALRLKGLYLAMLTLAFVELCTWIFIHWEPVTYGTDGFSIPPPSLGPLVFSTDKTFKHKLDQRLLGVQVGVPRDSRPVGFVDDPQPGEGKPTAPATSAAKEETKTLKGPPTEAAPGKALGAPKDEPKPAPKAAPKK